MNDLQNNNDELGGARLDELVRIYQLLKKKEILATGKRKLPKCQERELQGYIEKYGMQVLDKAKKVFSKEKS